MFSLTARQAKEIKKLCSTLGLWVYFCVPDKLIQVFHGSDYSSGSLLAVNICSPECYGGVYFIVPPTPEEIVLLSFALK